MPRTAHRLRSASIAVLVAVAGAVLTTPSAHAVTVAGPAGTTVTLDTDQPRPGQRIAISGTGFVPVEAPGVPHIAIKVNDGDVPGFRAGGTNAITGHPSYALMWFEADAQGRFSGTIDVPQTFTARGPGADGAHSFRILSGAFSSESDEPQPSGGPGTTAPVTFAVPFRIATPTTTVGLTGPSGIFRAGSIFRAGASVTLRGSNFDASRDVSVKLGTTAQNAVAVPSTATTDGDGTIVQSGSPATNRFTVPTGTAPGTYTLVVSTGTATETRTVTVAPDPTVTIETPAVRPGGLVAVRVRNFVSVEGAGQKVAIVDGTDRVLGCVTASATGEGSGAFALPTSLAAGAQTLRFAVGTRCLGPTGAADDLPTSFNPRPYSISDTAPQVEGPGELPRNATTVVRATGLAAGAVLTPRLDGTELPTVTAQADGTAEVPIAVPGDAVLAERLLTLTGTGTGVARRLTVVPEVVAPPTTTPTTGAPPTDTTPSQTTAAPTVTTPPTATQPAPGPTVAPTPLANATVKSVQVRGARVRVNVGAILGRRTTVSVKSASRIRVARRSKAKVVTFAATTTTRAGVLSIALRKDGLAALKRLKRITVVVRLAPAGGKVVTRRLVLRR